MRAGRPARLRTALVAALAALAAAAGCAPDRGAELPERGAEIVWDEHGVPHIYAATDRALFRAFGWAQMDSHGGRLLRLFAAARGRAAEHFGEEELASDRWVHTVGIPDRAEAWLEAQDPDMRGWLEAFAGGMNAWTEQHPDALAPAAREVLPLRASDVLALAQYDIHFTFMANAGIVRRLERSWTPGSVVEGRAGRASGAGERHAGAAPAPGGRAAPGAAGHRRSPGSGVRDVRPPAASNAWAVGPSRSASGDAMLLANPHLPWSGLFTWYEAHLVSPGTEAYGATLLGFPVLGIAFNRDLGWTHTVNTHDGADLYELALTGDGYRFDGRERGFETEEVRLLVRQEDGGVREESLTVRRSVHGPVLARKGGHAVALRVAGLDQPGLFRQYWEMMGASDLEEFESALRRLQIPMFTVMYADREGHVLHLFGGRTPVRPEGERDWGGLVPGDTSATLWTETHGYDELPRVVDPASGWLQNANDPPWTTTFPRALDPDSFPGYMAPRRMIFRAQRSAQMLTSDSSVTFEELIRYKHSTRMALADRLLDDLLPAARERGGERARRAADVLEAWDREADADSRGAVLFRAFAEELGDRTEGSFFARPWSPEAPLETPDGLADPGAAVEALAAAASTVEGRWGRLDPAWGETRRFRLDTVDLPGNGASGELGVFRVVGWERTDGPRHRAGFGDSFVAAVEFGDTLRARALLGYGNASTEGSPHRTDQLRHMAEQELRPIWLDRGTVEAHAERTTVVDPEAGPDGAPGPGR